MALGKKRPVAKPTFQVNRNIIAAIVSVIVLACLYMCSRQKESTATATRFLDNYGHLMRLEEKNGTQGIVDDPECEKCQKILHEAVFKAIVCAFDSMEVRVVE